MLTPTICSPSSCRLAGGRPRDDETVWLLGSLKYLIRPYKLKESHEGPRHRCCQDQMAVAGPECHPAVRRFL